jgi:hypothetical protein
MRQILTVAMVLMVALSGATAMAQQGPPEDAGPPENIKKFTSTESIPQDRLLGNTTQDIFYNNSEDESALRVEEEYIDEINVSVNEDRTALDRNLSGNTTPQLVFDVTIDNDSAENVTFYVQKSVVEEADQVENLSMLVNNNSSRFYVDEDAGPGNSPWVLFTIKDFSTNTVAFQGEGSGPNGTFSDEGMPEGIESFLSTSPITQAQTDDSELTGKIRVSDSQKDTVNINMTQNDVGQTTLLINNTNNTSTTFYVQTQALESVTNESTGVLVNVDGNSTNSTLTEQGGANWVAFEVDHFSEREVTIQSTGGASLPGGSFMGIPILVLGGGIVALTVAAGYLLLGNEETEWAG